MSFLLILLAPLIGILVGLIPALGASLMMLLLYPFLLKFEPAIIILFYAVMVNARDFSGSVSAIGFGLCGEMNSIPALKERKLIIENNQQSSALKNTMIGSLFGTIVGSILLYFSVMYSVNYPFFLRSDILAVFISIASLMLIFWTSNRYYINIFLIFFGLLLGSIGFNTIKNQEFLTFGNSYLSGGIPLLPFLFGIYVLPKMIEIFIDLKIKNRISIYSKKKINILNLKTLFRGSIIGSICGLIPYVGKSISSNIAHFVENNFYKKNNVKHGLIRLNAAETANNAGQITMLIPLLILGIGLQPSELILLELIESKGWLAHSHVDAKFLFLLLISLIIGSLIAGFFCYNIVKKLLSFFYKNYKIIVILLILISVVNIFYLGYTADQIVYYILIFIISSIIGLIFIKKIDFAPLIIMFLLQDSFSNLARILPQLYGF